MRARRAFTLVEAIAVIVVMGVAVPGLAFTLIDAARVRASAEQSERAVWLAGAALETVIADAHSDAPGLGFEAFEDEAAYLETPGTGLMERMAWAGSAAPGATLEVTVGGLVGPEGVATGDEDRDVFRYVRARVSWTSVMGRDMAYEAGVLLGEL